jgi:hypothetical protein
MNSHQSTHMFTGFQQTLCTYRGQKVNMIDFHLPVLAPKLSALVACNARMLMHSAFAAPWWTWRCGARSKEGNADEHDETGCKKSNQRAGCIILLVSRTVI